MTRPDWRLLTTLLLAARAASASPPLETETAQLARKGELLVDAAYEVQTSAEGKELAAPLAIEYGLTDRIEALVEPVLYTSIRPDGAMSATGLGDLETTVTARLLDQQGIRPAFAVAGEVKIPTAKNSFIGSGQPDATFYLIASRSAGRFDTHANVGYAFIGSPTGVQTNNVYSFALAEEVRLNDRYDLVSEVFGSTAALPEASGGTESRTTPEIGGSELVGMLGARYHPASDVSLYLAVSYDNNQAVLLRPGITFGLR